MLKERLVIYKLGKIPHSACFSECMLSCVFTVGKDLLVKRNSTGIMTGVVMKENTNVAFGYKIVRQIGTPIHQQRALQSLTHFNSTRI